MRVTYDEDCVMDLTHLSGAASLVYSFCFK